MLKQWCLNHKILCSSTESIAFSYEVVCPETWVKFRGSCYNFKSVMLEMSLEEARDHCRKKGSPISTVNSGLLLIIGSIWVACFLKTCLYVLSSFRKFFRRFDSSGWWGEPLLPQGDVALLPGASEPMAWNHLWHWQ